MSLEKPLSSPTPDVTEKLVRAGAGAGKTTKLIATIVDFAFKFKQTHQRFPKLVVCTFTRKATQELRERLIKTAMQRQDWEFLKYATSSQINISTIHGLLSKYLGRFGFRMDLDPQFLLVQDSELQTLAKKIIRDILNDSILNEDEKTALMDALTVTALSACAIKYSDNKSFFPQLKAHDNKSLQNILEQQMLAREEELKALIKDWQLVEEQHKFIGEMLTWLRALKQSWSELPSSAALDGFPRKPTKISASTADLFASTKKWRDDLKKKWELLAYDRGYWPRYEKLFSICEKVFRDFDVRFRAAKTNSGRLQISDLENFSLQCLREHPDTAQMFSIEWDYWLIDEYQDTSPVQVELIHKLKSARPAFVVGDPQQSIYLFRGARSEVFADKERSVVEMGGVCETLETNYRSQARLVAFFNDYFKTFGGNFISMRAADNAKVSPLNYDVKFFITDDMAENYKAVISQVQSLIGQGAHPEDICILARKNQSLKNVAKVLNDYNIPTLLHTASGFYQRREIIDAMMLLRFLINPLDDSNLVGLLRSPWFKVSDQLLVQASKSGESNSLWGKLQRRFDLPAVEELKKYLQLKTKIGTVAAFKQGLLGSGYLDFSHYQDITGRREANLWKFIVNLEVQSKQSGFNLVDFIDESQKLLDLEQDSDQDAVAAKEVNRVNLMTIHQSKGLQFNHVLVLDFHQAPLQRGNFGSALTIDEDLQRFSLPLATQDGLEKSLGCWRWQELFQQREIQEYDRLLYVAFTRAALSLSVFTGKAPEKQSWLDRFPLSLEPGSHEANGYFYEVDCGPWPVKAADRSQRTTLVPRAPFWTETFSSRPTSVTGLLHAKSEGEKKSKQDIPGKKFLFSRLESIHRGVKVHKILELMRFHQDQSHWQRYFPDDLPDIERSMDYVRSLPEPTMSELLHIGFVEWGFIMKTSQGILEGQIDLWGIVNDTAWIVDYKTGSVDNRDYAFKQMSYYAEAIQQHGVKQKIQLVALFPLEQKVFIKAYQKMLPPNLEAQL